MGQITRGTDTSTSVLHVTWTALTGDDEGGSIVLSYFL